MIIDFNKTNGGGGGGETSGDVQNQIESALTAYYTSGETETAITSKGYITSAQTVDYLQDNYMTSAATIDSIMTESNCIYADLTDMLGSGITEFQLYDNLTDALNIAGVIRWDNNEEKFVTDNVKEVVNQKYTIGFKSEDVKELKSALFDFVVVFQDENDQDGTRQPLSNISLCNVDGDFVNMLDDEGGWDADSAFVIDLSDQQNPVACIENIPAGSYKIRFDKTYNEESYFEDVPFTVYNSLIDDYEEKTEIEGAYLNSNEDALTDIDWTFSLPVERLELKIEYDSGTGESTAVINIQYAPNEEGITSGDVVTIVESYGYLTSADTTNFVTSADTNAIQTQLDEVERVTSIALNELHTEISGISIPDTSAFITSAYSGFATTDALSAVTVELSEAERVTSTAINDIQDNMITSGQVETQITSKGYITSAATQNMVTSTYVSSIWKGTQAQYDALVSGGTINNNTLYIIV